ncbi:hypothetical protein ACOMHN_052586 [Nucella lapillus]
MMTGNDSDLPSKARFALIAGMQKLFVFELANGATSKDGDSAISLNVTAAVYPLGPPRWNFSVVNIIITIFAFIVIFCTLSGNTLVILAVVKERRLRKVSNSFIMNLAVSDVLVGVLVMPLALLYHLHGHHWALSLPLCHFWVSMDVICCTASIASLCAISYDRYCAITRPLRYACKRTRRRACYLILVIWVYSAAIALPPFLGLGEGKDGVESKQSFLGRGDVQDRVDSKNVLGWGEAQEGVEYKPFLGRGEAREGTESKSFLSQEGTGSESKPFLAWEGGRARGGVEEFKQCTISQHAGYTLYSTIGAFYLPLSFMLFAYVCIYRETSKRTRQWRSGPGSSKMISERDCQGGGMGTTIPMASVLVEEEEEEVREGDPASSPPLPPCAASPTSSTVQTLNTSPWSEEAFFRNLSKESCQSTRGYHAEKIRLDSKVYTNTNTITEEEECTPHPERSSSSDCSLTSTKTPPRFLRTTALVNGTAICRTTLLVSKKADHPPLRSTYGSFPHKQIRQIPTHPSSDSSTLTTSSSELLPDQSHGEHRSSTSPLCQNAEVVSKGRKEFRTQRLCKGNGSSAEDSPRSVNSTTSLSSTKLRYGNHITPPPADCGGEGIVNHTPRRTKTSNGCLKARLKRQFSLSQEKRAAKTLSVVLGCFIVCWLPFFVVALLKPLCVTCQWPTAVSDVVLWLGYCNSALNPIIYTFFNKDFRFAFRNLLCCCACCFYRCCRRCPCRRRCRCHNPAAFV